MPEDRLDKKIKELLENVQEDYDQTSWGKLSSRLDEDAKGMSEDDAFIPIIKEKLDNQRSATNEEHWAALSSELDHIEERKKRLYIVKFLEAAIVLLLVFTYYNYTQYSSPVEMNVAYMDKVHEAIQNPSVISAELNVSKEFSQNIDLITSIDQDIRQTPLTSRVPMLSKNFDFYSSFDKVLARDVYRSEALSLSDEDVSSILDLYSFNESSDEAGPSEGTIETLGISLFNVERELPELSFYPIFLKIDLPVPDRWTIGIPLSYDVNFINTDINLGYLSSQIESGLGGKSLGVSVAYRKKSFEIESGLRYSEKTFVPGKLTNYSKFSDVSFLEDQLDHMVIKQVQIPLLARIYASPLKKSSVYAFGGMAVNAVLHNKYAINRTVQSKARFAQAPTLDVVDLQELQRGILKGDPIKDNLYLTGVIGFGVESTLLQGVSWYLQPQYQHSFTGQANEIVDRINTLSLEGGVKYSF